MKYGTWKIGEFDPQAVELLERAGYHPLTARVLSARGCKTAADAHAALDCDAPLCDPFLMRDMKTAADRLRLAVARREHIAVYGDYDVDGITATCLLTDYLRGEGGRVTSYIPARLEEGYGLNEVAIRQLSRRRVDLIVTVDCGITACEEALLCKRLGIDLIVTDHHECKDELPVAAAVVDPHRPDETYPHTDLSGVGVAFKLACAISGKPDEMLARYADLVCLGLIADVMPLRGEVRTLVQAGLEALNRSERPGILALRRECGCEQTPVTTGTIGFVLAPRINAAGRMGQVELALRLFLTRDPREAADLAAALCRLNRDRQRVESGIYAEAVAMLPPGERPPAIVLASEGWHQGVVGIVASRLSEEYHCPAFLICLDAEGKGKASSRSYGGFNLFSALTDLSDLLESYGGHELAAGFTVRRENVDAFRRAICAKAAAARKDEPAGPALAIDCAVPPALLTAENIDALSELEPCGCGCPSPLFCLRDVLLEQLSEIGGGRHLRLRFRYGAGPGEVLNAVYFSATQRQIAVAPGDRVDVAYTPQINEYRGFRNVQLNLTDIRSSELTPDRENQQELYRRFVSGGRITPAEAARLLPIRAEFVEVWRYLRANAENGTFEEDFACLNRRLRRKSGMQIPPMRTRLCLDVFQELDLITLTVRRGDCKILLTGGDKKVDLDHSSLIRRLKEIKRSGQLIGKE